ncbi:MAG: hypothetical protein K9N46_07950 [Candidatus Marinimicrobia bacterium]|nr:hypothetical protein [Candidatus Neomarinimicrobiota bacterium]MCF7828739.1 hypothetical protein [Candidatus Neomarinimicrobiota bacterium]MCF7880656.1 hypothetical protein [Candidatus Neomarinimicrobiota bacterium]
MYKNIIFCLSYLNIPITLQLIENYGADRSLVITNNDSLFEFFSYLYGEQILFSTEKPSKYAEFYNQINPIKGSLYFLISWVNRIKYKKIFLSISDKDVYFFIKGYAIFEAFIVKLLSKNNEIFYKRSVDLSQLKGYETVLVKIQKKLIKAFYGVEVDVLNNADRPLFALSNEFLNNIKVNFFELPDNIQRVKKPIIDKFDIGKYKGVLLSGNTVDENFVQKNDFVKNNDKLIKYMMKKFGKNNLALKLHPRYNTKYSKEHQLPEINKVIPVSLIADSFDFIIGYASAALFETANNGGLSISTLEYFEPISTNMKNKYIDYLHNNLIKGNNIYYFKNLQELENIFNLFGL